MSATSGPIVPGRIGKLMDGEPSLKFRVAVRSVMTYYSQAESETDAPDGGASSHARTALSAFSSGATTPSSVSCRPDSRSQSSLSLSSSNRSRAAISSSEMPSPRASRNRARTRSFSSIPRRQRQRRRLSSTREAMPGINAARSASSPDGGEGHRSHGPLDHELLDLADRFRRIQVLRTDVDAIHDRVASEQAVRIIQVVEALAGRQVARIGDEAVRRKQPGGADELVRVPPE